MFCFSHFSYFLFIIPFSPEQSVSLYSPSISVIDPHIVCIYRVRKISMPNLREVPKQGYIVKQLYVGHTGLQHRGPSNWVLLRLEIKQNHWSILKKVVICYQFRPDVQIYGQWPWNTASARGADLTCALKNARFAASTILFRINWWYVSWVFDVHSVLVVLQTITDLVKRLEWRQHAQPVCI
jgi:hypothetical protein